MPWAGAPTERPMSETVNPCPPDSRGAVAVHPACCALEDGGAWQ